MGLPNMPIIKKFFTNKVESSRPEWGDYLLEIADIFSMFDGEELNRDLLTDHFLTISGRSPYALRDIANFRDEFGAYGTYLGVFYFKNTNGIWRIYLSKSAKHFLCSTEPDVESFCRTQLALFQYPNGAGSVQNRNGTARVQSNVLTDTIREIQHNIHLNPLRLLCRTVVTMHEFCGIPLKDIVIPYRTIFMLFNDNRINQNFSPSFENIQTVLESYNTYPLPDWVNNESLTRFKRNFHIMERTGIFSRRSTEGLILVPDKLNKAYNYAKEIAEMQNNFNAFESCYGSENIAEKVTPVILSSLWSEYYDALTLPMGILSKLTDDIDVTGTLFYTQHLETIETTEDVFPEFRTFQSNQIRAFAPTGNQNNLHETIIRREKANREHARILNMLAALIRLNGYEVYENTFIDLYVATSENTFIFEVKSNNDKNTLSQIRKAISQLYEYRYRSEKTDAVLCIVLQQRPNQAWIENYLLYDRNILICWLVDDIRLECPNECRETLASIGIIE